MRKNTNFFLLVAHEDIDRCACEIPVLADFVLQIAAIRLLDPLGKVAEKNECRHLRTLKHGDILDFHKFALVAWWRESCYFLLHHVVELRRRHRATAVFEHCDGRFHDLVDTLFGQSGGEYWMRSWSSRAYPKRAAR